MTDPLISDSQTSAKSAHSCARYFLLAFLGACLAGALIYPFHMVGRHWGALFNLAHSPTFFGTYLLIVAILDPGLLSSGFGKQPVVRLKKSRLLLLAVFLFVAGALGEIVQSFVGREPSFRDVAANAAGLTAAVLCCFVRRHPTKWVRGATNFLAATLLLLPELPPTLELVECFRQWREFPLLASFERSGELTAWNQDRFRIRIDSVWATHGSRSLRIERGETIQNRKRKYPTAAMIWPMPDWSEYTHLEMDLYNPQTSELPVGINIADDHHQATGFDPSDRFIKRLVLAPSAAETVTIDLEDVVSAPKTREMIMTHISHLSIYIVESEEDLVLYVDHIRLTR